MTQTDTSSPEFQAAFEEAAAAMKGEPPADSFKPVTEEAPPATEVKAEEAPAPASDAPAAAPETQPEDEVARLRRELEEARHRERSASARVSAFHKKLNDTQRELETIKTQAAAPAAAEPMDPELQAALDEMPEVAKLVQTLIDKKVGAVKQEVDKVVAPLQQDAERQAQAAEQAAVKSELAVVEQEFPNWKDIVNSDDFKAWTDSLTPALRLGWDNAATGADALEFLRMHRERTSKPAAPPSAQEKLAKAVGLPSRTSPPSRSGLPSADDYEGSFAHFAAQMRRA
jgi:hypothetical protein